MLEIERQDKQPIVQQDEIQKNWRMWADEQGYIQTSVLHVEQQGLTVNIEIFENPLRNSEMYLLYVPKIPHTASHGKLYIINDRDYLSFMGEASQRMVAVALIMAQSKRQ